LGQKQSPVGQTGALLRHCRDEANRFGLAGTPDAQAQFEVAALVAS